MSAPDWFMPDGSIPMLSIAGFIRRFGQDEVLRMTDDGTGEIDRDLLIAALTDAQGIAEGHLTGRYMLPFASVPVLVETIVADLARARLYTNEPPENVGAAARIAVRNLEKIQSGQIGLGTAALIGSNGSDPVRFTRGSAAYPKRLRDY